jgi:hypothetical protein
MACRSDWVVGSEWGYIIGSVVCQVEVAAKPPTPLWFTQQTQRRAVSPAAAVPEYSGEFG